MVGRKRGMRMVSMNFWHADVMVAFSEADSVSDLMVQSL